MYYLGIDLGGTKIAAGIVTKEGRILHKKSIHTFRERDSSEIIKDMGELANTVIDESGLQISQINSLGIGCPGIVNSNEGIVVYSCNLNFNNIFLKEEMNKYIDLPIYMENDANCAALAEAIYGASKDAKSSIMITIGTGIGGGIVFNKKIYSGCNYVGGELGHMVIEMDGERCNCGRNGCFEVYASATALMRQANRAIAENPNSLLNRENLIDCKVIFEAAQKGDIVAKKVVNNYIKYLAEGITNIVNIFQPEVIVIGGGVSNQKENMIAPMRSIVDKSSYTRDGIARTEIKVALMGNDAGIIGASLLGIDNMNN